MNGSSLICNCLNFGPLSWFRWLRGRRWCLGRWFLLGDLAVSSGCRLGEVLEDTVLRCLHGR